MVVCSVPGSFVVVVASSDTLVLLLLLQQLEVAFVQMAIKHCTRDDT